MRLLNEKISPTVYHITSPKIATQILKTGEFKASEALRGGKDAEMTPTGYNYFISTARSRRNYFSLDYITNINPVMLVLDGNKLNTRFKGGAVDYFSSKHHSQRHKQKSETEDRIYLKQPIVKNFPDYISEVLIYAKYSDTVKKLSPLLLQLKKHNIPYYLFKDVQDIYTDNKKKALTSKEIIALLKNAKHQKSGLFNFGDAPRLPSNKKITKENKDILITLINLYFSKSVEEFMRRNKSAGSPLVKNVRDMEKYTGEFGIRDMISNVNHLTFTPRDDKDRYIPEDQRYIKVIEKILAKERIRKLNDVDFIKKLTTKWQNLI